MVVVFFFLPRFVTVAQEGVAGGGGGGGGGTGLAAGAAGAAGRGLVGAGAKAGGAGVTMSTTLSSAATCDLMVVSSPRRNFTVSTRAEMESAWRFSSLAIITPNAVGLNWYRCEPSAPCAAKYLVYSEAQSMGGSGGGGGEVVVLGRLGVAERVIGVEEPEPPDVNL